MGGFLGFFIARDSHTSRIGIAISGFVFALLDGASTRFGGGRIRNSLIYLDHLASFGNFRAIAGTARWVRFCKSAAIIREPCRPGDGFVFPRSALSKRQHSRADFRKSSISLDHLASFRNFNVRAPTVEGLFLHLWRANRAQEGKLGIVVAKRGSFFMLGELPTSHYTLIAAARLWPKTREASVR
jgi:hypothetical protein